MTGDWTLHEGNALAVLPQLPAASIQCCVTSPPYYGLRDYGAAGQIGLEATPIEYVARLVAVFEEVRRVLRDDGTLWLNIGDSYASPAGGNAAGRSKGSTLQGAKREVVPRSLGIPSCMKPKDMLGIPWRLAFALQDAGWYLRSDCIWCKASPMPESVRDRPTKAHEYVFLLTKRERYFYDQEAERGGLSAYSLACMGSNWTRDNDAKDGNLGCRNSINEAGVSRAATVNPAGRNLWTYWTDISPEPYPEAHFATFPPALPTRCIRLGTSEKGCCPKCGAPWRRNVAHRQGDHESAGRPKRTAGMDSRTSTLSLSGNGSKEWAERGGRRQAVGWVAGCRCDAGGPVPCTVLDPFAGAATTLLAALRLSRRAVGVELNPAYAALGRARLIADCPLFNKAE